MSQPQSQSGEFFLACKPAQLPDHLQVEAADRAGRINPANRVRLPSGVPVPSPARLAAMAGKFWTAGQTLTWCFIDGADTETQRGMQASYDRWAEYVNLVFQRTDNRNDADFRWARENDGYWSMIGTDCNSVPIGQPTGNLQGFNARTPLRLWKSVADHENGHAIGFGHTQLLPEIVNRIDPEKAYRYFGGPPNNWPKSVTYANVLKPYRPGDVTLANVQLTSVMMYGLPGEIMKDGVGIPGGTGITPEDGLKAGQIYPGKVPVVQPPPPGGPPKLSIGVPITDTISAAKEVDQFLLEVTEPGRYAVDTQPPMELAIYKGRGTGKSIDHGYDEAAPVAKLKPGPHVIKVMHRFVRGTGEYTLVVSRVS